MEASAIAEHVLTGKQQVHATWCLTGCLLLVIDMCVLQYCSYIRTLVPIPSVTICFIVNRIFSSVTVAHLVCSLFGYYTTLSAVFIVRVSYLLVL